MKKLLAILLAAVMLFSFGACGSNTKDNKSIKEVKDYTISVSENVPEYFLEGTYADITEDARAIAEGMNYEALCAYLSKDGNTTPYAVGYYAWPDTGLSLLEEAAETASAIFVVKRSS